MRYSKTSAARYLRLAVAACMAMGVLSACTAVGPDAIRSGRLAYNEAILETSNQQMLLVPIHNRYEENNHLLTVASVTANVRVSSSAQVEAGFGDSDNYTGNLVPFSGGFIYEENPTISYKPVTGEAYLHELSSPVPLRLFIKTTRSLPDPAFAYGMLLASINGIHNPAFLYNGQQDDPRFDRLVSSMTQLGSESRIHWVSTPDDREGVTLIIDRGEDADGTVNALLDLLGLKQVAGDGRQILIPVSMSLNAADNGGIGVITRSIWELIEVFTAAVHLPAADEASGAATSFPPLGRVGNELNIRYANEAPENAYVAVEHRAGWFYISDTDLATKRYFKLLGSLWSAAMSQSLDDGSATPVLTVPVSR